MEKLRIAAYVQMNALVNPTGLGKHILNMAKALQAMDQVDLRFLAARDRCFPGEATPEMLAEPGRAFTVLPHSRKLLEMSWLFTGWPSADRWAGDADWIYSPTEVLVPSRRCRLAATSHHLEWLETDLPWSNRPDMKRARLKWRYRLGRIFRRASVILVVSEYLRQRAVELFDLAPASVFAVGNGVEQQYYDIGDQPRTPGRRPYLLVIGGLLERKGAPIILEAARILSERNVDLQIWVAGTGEERFRALAEGYPNIKCLGYPGLDILPRLLRDAAALAFPSRYEGFGIPAAEAMAAGTPPIVSHWTALPEVVADGGVILKEDSAEALVEAAVRLASDEDYRAGLAAKGRARATAFKWEACAIRLVRALQATPA